MPVLQVVAAGLFEDGWAAGAADDGVGDSLWLGAEVLSEVGGVEFVELHHGQVVVQEVVIALNHLTIAHPVDGPLRRGAWLSHESDVSLGQRGGYWEVVSGDDTVGGHGLDTLLRLQLGLAGLVQVTAQQVAGGEDHHVLEEVGPAVGSQEEAGGCQIVCVRGVI